MGEPSIAALSADGAGATIRRYFLATRPPFLTASILPVLAGTAWGASVANSVDLVAGLLALLATIAVHAGSNVYNDVSDELNGTDRINEEHIHPFTGGSRFIQNGVLTLQQMRRWALLLFAAGIVLGAALIALKGIGVLFLGLAGIALGALYSLPAVQLSGRGFGETAVAVAFGILPVCGAAWLQSGIVDLTVVLISIPISCWVAAILLINEVPDRIADEQVGKRTWVVRFGRGGTRRIYLLLHTLAAIAGLVLVLQRVFPWWAVVVPLLLLAASFSAATAITANDRAALEKSIKMTLAIHAVGALWWTAAILIAI